MYFPLLVRLQQQRMTPERVVAASGLLCIKGFVEPQQTNCQGCLAEVTGDLLGAVISSNGECGSKPAQVDCMGTFMPLGG